MNDFFNFNLPTTAPQQVKEYCCQKCGYKYFGYIHVFNNGQNIIGSEKPPCSRCGSKEVTDIHG